MTRRETQGNSFKSCENIEDYTGNHDLDTEWRLGNEGELGNYGFFFFCFFHSNIYIAIISPSSPFFPPNTPLFPNSLLKLMAILLIFYWGPFIDYYCYVYVHALMHTHRWMHKYNLFSLLLLFVCTRHQVGWLCPMTSQGVRLSDRLILKLTMGISSCFYLPRGGTHEISCISFPVTSN